MKTRKLGILLFAAIFISTATIAQPRTDKNKRDENRPNKKEMMMKRNSMRNNDRQSFFTEEQKESMKTIRMATVKKVKPLKNELGELNARQKTLTTADDADLKAIYKNIEKIAEVKIEIAKIMAKQQQDFRAMLTDEQLIKFDNLKENQRKRGTKDFQRHRMERGERTPAGRGV